MARLNTLAAVLFGMAALSASKAASAASDYVIVMLDATGSMYTANWNTAIKQAKASVQNYVSAGTNTVSRGFAFYTFKDDATQHGITQVWPTASTTCTKETPATGTTTFCVYPPDDLYTQLVGTISTAGQIDTIINGYGPTNGVPRTPLAKSLCQIITAMKVAAGTTTATIVLESDGQENETQLGEDCYGPDANVDAGFTPNTALVDRGYPLVNGTEVSWQARALRRAFQYDSSAPNLNTPVPANAAFPVRLTWNVSPIYTFYPATATSSSSLLLQASTTQTSTAQLSAFELPDGAQPTFTQQLLRAAAGYAPTAVTATSSAGTTSMSPAELGLFKALGKANAKSKYTEFVSVSGQTPVYGVNHKVPGDVDDSGCSDIADYRVIYQKDVWLKRAVTPLQIAIKADLNRDGWVDQSDTAVLLANWGKGCKYPVQPPPKP